MKLTWLLLLLSAPLLVACGGESSSDEGTVVRGSLLQGTTTGHALAKHSEGQPLGNVDVCVHTVDEAKCTRTNDEGEWGLFLETPYTGGKVDLKVEGHGIFSELKIEAVAAEELVIALVNNAGTVSASSVQADGVLIDDDHHHDEHEDHSQEPHDHD